MKNIVANIEAIRKQKGIKQAVLAEKMGISQPTYSGYLTQNQDIRYSLLLDIANKLDISVIDIITYPEKYYPESDACNQCREKDDIIRNLNDYIKMLTNKK
jgi:transcriptional regulator with XRE-family HTH domain